MKKRLALAFLSAVIALSLASCKCPAEKATLDRLEDQQEKIFAKYTAYVNADPKFATDAKAKDDEQKLLQSIRDMVLALKRSMGD